MSVDVNYCPKCGRSCWTLSTHFCPVLGEIDEGTKVVRPITEDDVRRIVREELEKRFPPGVLQG